jgi:hypothetical protein
MQNANANARCHAVTNEEIIQKGCPNFHAMPKSNNKWYPDAQRTLATRKFQKAPMGYTPKQRQNS